MKQVPYTVCKPVCYTKTIDFWKCVHQDDRLLEVRAQVRAMHGDEVRSGGSLQASPGDGLLPDAVLQALRRRSEVLCPSRLLQLRVRDPLALEVNRQLQELALAIGTG